ncbi:MAG: pyridoxal 5'-phosphate synthase [Deltaproteobacteria bacterium]|nr:pyridoxal 5'-phosphate synthase [Deltaproteobacteria bacterium]
MVSRVGNFRIIPRLRREYHSLEELGKLEPSKDPFKFFKFMFRKACVKEFEANAAVLCTSKANGRVVLVKNFEKSFWFFTSKYSQKVKELNKNSSATLLFYWPSISCQVRIRGKTKVLPRKISLEYFYSRPFEAQLAFAISKQSEKLRNWHLLRAKFLKLRDQRKKIPCPQHWIGFELNASTFEFWFGNTERLHRRFLFKKKNKIGWVISELYP